MGRGFDLPHIYAARKAAERALIRAANARLADAEALPAADDRKG